VARIYPELVIRNASGHIDAVRYDALAALLLREVRQQQIKIAAQGSAMRDLKQWQLVAQTQQMRAMQKQMAARRVALSRLQAKDELLARR
jgi:hypothetical protein